jgi:hypothetical protein
MRNPFLHRFLAPSLLLAALSACGDAPDGPATVSFVEPADGETVTGPDVNVVLDTDGVDIVPIADTTPGTGHHHIFIDSDVTPANEMVPQGQDDIRHFGTGATEFVLTGLEPGQHRLIAVVADWEHVPLDPMVADTITITVTPPGMP